MLLSWISFDLDYMQILGIWFAMYVLFIKWNIGYYIRKVFKISQTKPIKILECFPCQSFWVALVASSNPVVAMGVFLLAVLTQEK